MQTDLHVRDGGDGKQPVYDSEGRPRKPDRARRARQFFHRGRAIGALLPFSTDFVICIRTGSVAQPRTLVVRAFAALSWSTSQSGQRVKYLLECDPGLYPANAAPRQK